MDLSQPLYDGAVVGAVVGAVALALWPRHGTGERFLRRWHVAEPNDEQVRAAVRYLRNRRPLVVPLMLLSSLAASVLGLRRSDGGPLDLFRLLGSLLLALLLAESLAALRRPRGSARTALLVRRRARDLLPAYAMWLHLLLTLVTAGMALAGLAVQRHVDALLARLPANEVRPDYSGLVLADGYRADLARAVGLPIVAGAVLTAVVVLAVVWRTTTRPAERDDRVDLVLRVRSARVAVGTGIALTGMLGVAAANRLSTVASFLHGQPTHVYAGVGGYPVGGPAFPADPGIAAVPGWLDAVVGLTGGLGLVLLLAGLLGWVWVANPPWPPQPPGVPPKTPPVSSSV